MNEQEKLLLQSAARQIVGPSGVDMKDFNEYLEAEEVGRKMGMVQKQAFLDNNRVLGIVLRIVAAATSHLIAHIQREGT